MTEDHISSTHPQLPPTTEETRLSWLRLLRSRRVGATTFHRLLSEHGTAEAALTALPDIARAAGMAKYTICPAQVAADELHAGRAADAQLILHCDPDYPAALKTIPDAPPLLWLRGDPALLQRPLIAMVGARNASSLGTRMARALAQELGQLGFVVVSGLARGIDAAAHDAALPTGTIAVFASGIDVTYPRDNAQLAKDIATQGLCLSEQPPGLAPMARHFPTRNRIISGLCRAVVVVEAAAKSGSLITARNALDQGRDVLAVPGHPFDARASGCNLLIRDGAPLVRSADDVLQALGPLGDVGTAQDVAPVPPDLPTKPAITPPSAAQPRSLRDTAALHLQILNRLGAAPLSEDQLIRDLDASSQDIAPALLDLELDGKIARQSGGLLSKS